MGVFDESPTASWQPDGAEAITFPVKSIMESGGNRLVPRERLYRPGAKQDSTGPMPRAFTTLSHFFVGVREEGVPPNAYPGQINALIEAMELAAGLSGTLTLQTRGPIRAKPHTWSRTETDDRVDFAVLQINWVLDNEDSQTAATFTPPTARSAAVPLALAVQSAAFAEGVGGEDVAALQTQAQALEEALRAPDGFADDINRQAQRLQDTIARVERVFGNSQILASDPTAALLLAPGAWAVLPALRSLSEMAARAKSSAAGTRAPIPRRYSRSVSLAFVARDVQQPLGDLISLNGGLSDIRQIAAGTPILVRRAV